jgi:hypothetical protein
MFQKILLLTTLVLSLTKLEAQISEGGIPYSRSLAELKSSSYIPQVRLKKLDMEKLLKEEDLNPGPVRFGIYTDTIIDIKVIGKTDIIPGKGKIWRLKISNENAKSLQVNFSTFVIPQGASLFLYNDNLSRQAGAFTKKNMRKDSLFVVADFKGNHVNIEYFEPESAEFKGQVVIGYIGQAFKDMYNMESETGFVNINCAVGKDAQLVKHAVCRMTFRSGIYESFCTGALINNAKVKGTPYFLTANHCMSSQDEASSLVTYFNYEIIGCDGDTAVPLTLSSGANLLSTAMPSDYTLLILQDTVPSIYQPYFAGWTVKDSATKMVTGVHNPFQHTKKISIEYDSIYSNPVKIPWEDDSESPAESHWVVGFDVGKTSGGSSGSPLFNSNNQIIGQLHGGNSAYDSTGTKEIDGYIPAGNPPDAFFTTESDLVCMNTPVKLRDYSVFGPYDRKWTITPSTFAYLNSTSNTSANPIVEFHEDKYYTINLDLYVAGVLKSTESKIIKAGNEINVEINSREAREICDCDFDSVQYIATGADEYSWSIPLEDEDKYSLNKITGDTVIVTRKPDFIADTNYSIEINVVGTKGTCSDNRQVKYYVIKPSNDDIGNAILIDYGRSAIYSNICATIEEGEPVPPITSCTSQLSWCDECVTGTDILKNSVWFKFIADETTNISISSTGFDNQVALYNAESYLGILSNDYTLLAANDDRSESDFRPLIISQPVLAGKTYWIQVDGSACGTVDDFYLNITNLSSSGTREELSSKLIIYPQPATDHIIIKGDELGISPVAVSLFEISGQQLYRSEIEIQNGEISLDISFLESGIYLIKLTTGNGNYISRIVKY